MNNIVIKWNGDDINYDSHWTIVLIIIIIINTNIRPYFFDDSFQHRDPIVTGTSILGIRYNGGVMLCSDTLGSYGSLARFRSIERIKKIGSNTIVGASGEYSDFQYITDLLEQLVDRDYCADDKIETSPKAIYQYLVRIMYNRRNRFNPLWNTLIVAGFKDGKSFLGYTDLLGSNFEDDTMASGYGAYLAKPILRNFLDSKNGDVNNISEQEAREVLEKCMKVLYYRDARSLNKIQIATATASGLTISEPYSLQTEWAFKGF